MSTDSTRTHETGPVPDHAPERRGRWRAITTIAAATVAAIVTNLLVLLAGRVADASFVLDDRGTPHVVTALDVVVASWPMVVGMALAVALARWRSWFLRVGQVLGGGLALLSVAGPMLALTDPGTRLALALMHLVVGAAVVIGLEAIRRRRSA